MKASDIRKNYLDFFKDKGHQEITPSPLVPENDPTTLFTSSGMQPLVPYLLGETHPQGKRLVDSQRSFRAQDIEEVGDNRHTTFFEMLGNWSLGDYFKEKQLPWFFEFLTNELKLDPYKLYVTVFAGNETIPKDDESIAIWKKLFALKNINAKFVDLSKNASEKGMDDGRIFGYDVQKNWWSRSGEPSNMPPGEPGGPDSEIFYDFGLNHNPEYGKLCHPNCECGRFLEIGNSVFMEFKKTVNGFERLPQPNVDFGGGLERLEAASINEPDIFKTSLFSNIRSRMIENIRNFNDAKESRVRIFLDHSRAAIFLVSEGVNPGKNEREYIVRRLIRRASDQLRLLDLDYRTYWSLAIEHYRNVYMEVYSSSWDEKNILQIVMSEIKLYDSFFNFKNKLKEELIETKNTSTSISTASTAAGPIAFKYQSTYGVPLTESELLINELNLNSKLFHDSFEKKKQKHQNLSRTASSGMFKGGLADHSSQTTKLHTATHLLHAVLRKVLGNHVSQKGSHITKERLRFDFSHPQKLTNEEITKVEDMVNQQIKKNLKVSYRILPYSEALKEGALAFFGERYQDNVKVYSIGDFSKEVCGGPHVDFTSVIGKFRIKKEESVSAGIRRIYAYVN